MVDKNLGDSTPVATPQSVPLHQASDADIAAYIANYTEEEESEVPEGNEEGNTQAPVSQVQEEAAKVEEQPQKAVSPEEHKRVLAKNQQLKEALEKQSLAWQRRSTEIGELRKALREANERLAQGLNEEFVENPERAIERKLQIRTNEEHLQQLDHEEAGLGSRVQAMQTVAQYVPEEEFDMQAMASSLQRDGVAPQVIQQFVTDPYSQTNGVTLIQLAKRAHAEKLLTHVYHYAKGLEQQIQELKSKPEQVLKNIEQLANKPKPMTAASGGSSQRAKANVNVRIDQLSDAELDEIIRQSR